MFPGVKGRPEAKVHLKRIFRRADMAASGKLGAGKGGMHCSRARLAGLGRVAGVGAWALNLWYLLSGRVFRPLGFRQHLLMT